ncbi:MAG: Cof-type HAD-IIB family hydrolase, partial [Oscillospiraceae bacterium]
MIKAVFLDVDNTLTSPITREIPQSAREAVRLARKNGVYVFVSTGRHTRIKEEGRIISDLELDGYVSLNGQICYMSDGTVFYKQPLDEDDVAATIKLSDELNFACSVSEFDSIYMNRENDIVRQFHSMIKIPLLELREVKDLRGHEVFSLAPYIDLEQEKVLLSLLRKSTIVRYNPITGDVIPANGGKHVGIEKTLKYLGLEREQAMAVGDGGNDISMIRYAGVGVAMGGSADEVMAAADYIAPGPDEDG